MIDAWFPDSILFKEKQTRQGDCMLTSFDDLPISRCAMPHPAISQCIIFLIARRCDIGHLKMYSNWHCHECQVFMFNVIVSFVIVV